MGNRQTRDQLLGGDGNYDMHKYIDYKQFKMLYNTAAEIRETMHKYETDALLDYNNGTHTADIKVVKCDAVTCGNVGPHKGGKPIFLMFAEEYKKQVISTRIRTPTPFTDINVTGWHSRHGEISMDSSIYYHDIENNNMVVLQNDSPFRDLKKFRCALSYIHFFVIPLDPIVNIVSLKNGNTRTINGNTRTDKEIFEGFKQTFEKAIDSIDFTFKVADVIARTKLIINTDNLTSRNEKEYHMKNLAKLGYKSDLSDDENRRRIKYHLMCRFQNKENFHLLFHSYPVYSVGQLHMHCIDKDFVGCGLAGAINHSVPYPVVKDVIFGI
jgi:hypothetical protein